MNIGFKTFHPAALFLFFCFSFVFCLTATNPLALAAAFACGIVYFVRKEKSAAKSYILRFILPLVIFVTVGNGLFSHYGVTVLFVMHNGNNFTLEALVCGFVAAVRTAGMLLWLEYFNRIITNEKIIFLFGRFSPRIALILSMALRFIPLIRTQSAEIVRAEKGIGNGLQTAKLASKMKTVTRRLSVLVSWTLEKGIDTADTMQARGYGLSGRTFYHSYVFKGRDTAVAVLSTAATVLSFVFNARYAASYNPIVDIPVPDVFGIVMLLYFCIILLLPLLCDCKEEKAWSVAE